MNSQGFFSDDLQHKTKLKNLPVIFLELANTYDVIINGISASKSFKIDKKKKLIEKKKDIIRLKSEKKILNAKAGKFKQKLEFGIIPKQKVKINKKQLNQVKGKFLK